MASKRKSTVPCMIPSKSKHMREEIILGCLPELLPTIPEDSILSISGQDSGHFPHNSSKIDGSYLQHRGGTYSCQTCRFESRDLNYFLDHMHNCHADFRAKPTFYCLNCGVSVVRFEALALHNTKAHPEIMEGLITASLQVNKRDGLTTVEQSLFTDSGEAYRESGLSLTKTPIAKMMKAKGEHKKIVVSHTVEVRKIDLRKEVDLSMLTNVPELQNGALIVSGVPAMPRTTVTNVNTTTVSNQVFHQRTPSVYTSPTSDSNKDLPKVMIPLSSIPTYDAAMDTSSFLKTSFGKFPYPTKAELCYLTVVSEFPEEQIKLWFTAQRLKQGISWSPEEIEEARRKMFNTIFQGGAPRKQPSTQHQISHIVTHHTIAAQPAQSCPVGPNYQMAKVPYGSLKGMSPAGVIATKASMSSNPQVTRVSYSAPVVHPKFQSVVRTQVPNKNTLTTLEPDKSNGLGLDMAGTSGCVGSTSSSRSSSSSSSCSSSSSISSYSSSSNGGETLTRKTGNSNSPNNTINSIITCSTNISNNDEHCIANSNNKPNGKINSIPVGLEAFNSNKSKVIIDNTSKSNISYNNHNSSISPQEQLHVTKADDDGNNNYIYMTKNGSISSNCPSTTCNESVPNLNHASKSPNESTSTTVITKSSSSSSVSVIDEAKCTKNFSTKGMSILQQLIKEEDSNEGDKNCREQKVDPIKINLKRLKMNEPEVKSGAEVVPHHLKPEMAEIHTSQPSFSPHWATKTPQQLHILQQVFSNTHWPSSQQYKELSVMTGLPKSEVVRWFSDSRYSHKNGQLKWLENYQCPPQDSDEAKTCGDGDIEMPQDPLKAQRKLVEQEMNKHLEGEAGLNSEQRGVWQDTYSPLLSLMNSEETGEQGRAGESVQPRALQDPWSERAEDHQQPVASQSFIEQQSDTSQAR
ncbi:zinc fingers and homeoboxes protein 3 isoform X2 [Lampris incognitus]|nr:zinc fingers and homeoboxes protein 3 isoform X2 [Lampris incognitus]